MENPSSLAFNLRKAHLWFGLLWAEDACLHILLHLSRSFGGLSEDGGFSFRFVLTACAAVSDRQVIMRRRVFRLEFDGEFKRFHSFGEFATRDQRSTQPDMGV